MTRTERLYRIDQLLKTRHAISRRELLDALECSQATLTRDIEYLRSQLNAPIVFDEELRAYRLEAAAPGPAYALPGLWFNDSEIHALLTIEHLLEAIQPGLLGPHIAPLRKRLESLLGKGRHAPDEIRRRILLLPANVRRPVVEQFAVCAMLYALLPWTPCAAQNCSTRQRMKSAMPNSMPSSPAATASMPGAM